MRHPYGAEQNSGKDEAKVGLVLIWQTDQSHNEQRLTLSLSRLVNNLVTTPCPSKMTETQQAKHGTFFGTHNNQYAT